MSKTFEVSFISEGKYFQAGTPIEDADIRPFMLRYHGKKAPSGMKQVNNLRKNYNTPYHVDAEGRMGHPLGQQIAELEAQNAEQDYVDDVASEPPNKTVASALDEAREEYQADVQRQIASAKIKLEHSEELAYRLHIKRVMLNIADESCCKH